MDNQYRLVKVGDSELLAALSELIRRGNQITGEMLAHLAEVEDRMLHLELGFASLHAYCVEALGMSEGAAGRRVASARVCRRFPQAFELVARGQLHLSALCALAPHLKPANAAELFESCVGRSRRQVDELLAARFPRADVKEQIRRLPIEALSAGRFGVHFTADTELRDMIERAKELASHRVQRARRVQAATDSGELSSLMKLVFAEFVAREEKRRFATCTPSRESAPSESAPSEGAPSEGAPSESAPRCSE